MSEHIFNPMNRRAVEAAEAAYAKHGMAEALRAAVKEALHQVQMEWPDRDSASENRDVVNILYCAGRLVPLRAP